MSYFLKQYNKAGTAPGQLEHDQPGSTVEIDVIRYDSDHYDYRQNVTIDEALEAPRDHQKRWLALQGKPAPELLKVLADKLGLHPLALEDVIHSGQRAKLDNYDSHLFLVLQRPRWENQSLALGQVSLFLGDDFVVSIDDSGRDPFEPIRKRLETSANGRFRSSGHDYLFYSLTDLIIDQAFPILDGYAEELEELELTITESPKKPDILDRLHDVRRELVFLRRTLWSQSQAATTLLREDIHLISPTTRLFLRDCADHANHILDMADSYRDMSVAVMELLLSYQNKQLNETMRVLTMIATIFIPLSFVTGVYGMNFDPQAGPWSMPELSSPYGYPLTLLGLVGIGVGMLVFFKRKGWI
ncbi:magnesium/cobalt transporter CorA [Marinobacteraceae bacterium S3BR75-40.1]